MIKIIIAGHGELPGRLLETVESITGVITDCRAISINPGEGRRELRHKIGTALEKFGRDEKFLFLTDVFGGSASNIGFSFTNDYKIRIITGVNLPMLLELANYREIDDLDELAFKLMRVGRDSIIMADERLKTKGQRLWGMFMEKGRKWRWWRKIFRSRMS
jgi:PTS system mannose-specific IIA component